MRPTIEDRKLYNVDYSKDTDFSAFARLLQSKWRAKKDLKEGKLGNFLDTDFSITSKANFLTENIKELVTREISQSKSTGALIKQPRIWNNLLSSQPLCFNLFGELHFDLELATKFFGKLFPGKIETVTSIKFEYSPGRGNKQYIGDHSAFDVFIEYHNKGKNGFIGIEVKYAESLKEETKEMADKNFKDTYADLTKSCNLFKSDSLVQLRLPPFSQIWRDHLLAISIVKKHDYDEGFFVFLFPSKNSQCQKGVDDYKTYLSFENEDKSMFSPRYLDDFILTLRKLRNDTWTRELEDRYIGTV